MKIFASSSRRLALFAAALVALTAFWLGVALWPLGRDNWFIKPAPPAQWWPSSAFVLPLGALVLCGGFAAMSAYDRFRRAKTRREELVSLRMSLGALILLATLLPWTMLGPRQIGGYRLVAATWSDISNQYFSTAYRIENARDLTRDYALWQRNPDVTKSHVATHPPGAVLFYYAARRVYENVAPIHQLFNALAPGINAASTESIAKTARAELKRANAQSAGIANAQTLIFPDDAVACAVWCAFLLSLCVGATVPAVYKLAAGESSNRSHGFDDKTATKTAEFDAQKSENARREGRGLMAAAFFALAPTTVFFAFTLDALVAFLVIWALLPVAKNWTKIVRLGEKSSRRFELLWSGALLGLACFVSFGALAAWGILVFAAIVAFGWRALLVTPQLVLSDILSRRKPAVYSPFSDFLLLVFGFAILWLGLKLLLPLEISAIYERAMQAHRAATWETRSRWGWAWLNLPTYALFCGWPVDVAVFAGATTQICTWRKHRNANWNAARVLGVAALLTALALSLSGNVRGETERLWFFLTPFLCAFGGAALLSGEDEIKYSNSKKTWCSGRILVVFLLLQALQTLLMANSLVPLVRSF